MMPVSLLAQLSAPGAKTVRYTSYPSSPAVKDPLFFYCNATGTETATLAAQRPGASGNYNYSWYKWDDGTGNFSIFITSQTGASSSVSGLSQGGYRVVIDSSGINIKNLTGWVFFDTPPVAEASLLQQLCNRVALSGKAEATTANFYYRDPVSAAPVTQKNLISFLWSSTPSSVIPYPDVNINPITYTPPLEDVTYKLQVNSLGCSNSESFFYESIHVNADFSLDPNQGEAPLKVTFTDKSIRGEIYTWDFGDESGKPLIDTVPIEDTISYTYYKPGEYTVLLTIESNLHCIDSLRSEIITVTPSSLDIPNVFSPDGDGYNDRFRIESKSLRYVSMEIFSQSGLKVYGFSGEGERLREWDGWDGKINNSSTEARPGVYFYIIRAYGWDDVKYDSKTYRGFLYLYR
jgi:PKD repeat protein